MSDDNNSRRGLVPFDPFYFEEQKKEGAQFSMKETFNRIYNTNHWVARDSVSGSGSESSQTETLLLKLRSLIRQLEIKHLLDVPCGDFNWMKNLNVPGLLYSGGDIVQSITLRNIQKYGSVRRKFFTVDITSGRLHEADLLFCRDCLVHLSFSDIERAIKNIKKYKIKYFLSTTFPDTKVNQDIVTGDWRPINLLLPPFNFPEPLELVNEKCTEADGRFRDKSLGLWKLSELP
jgi:hypothetical protein